MAKEGKLKAVIDPAGPFPLTTQGVRQAFRLQESRHAKGKVIVKIADLPRK
jgi:NADPH:quinone reductase-like Zn-dependent oxidoreductase